VRESFRRQLIMGTIGADLLSVEPGRVSIGLPFREDLTQQHGFLHAGVVATIVDSSCGYAALTLLPPDTGVLTIEYKISLTAPARGERFAARGRVVKPGRNLCFTEGEVWGIEGDEERLVATLSATIMNVADRGEIRG
jgi:uncharacterized protein (TIGR00369 family)